MKTRIALALAAALAGALAAGPPAFAAAAKPAAKTAARPDLTGVWRIVNYAAAVKTAEGSEPPLLPAARAVYDRNRALAARNDRSFDSADQCIPEGLPRLMLKDAPIEILQKDKAVYLVARNRLPRRIHLDEVLPVDPDPMWLGYSVGTWEGATLVARSASFREGTLLDDAGLPHSDSLRVTERFRLAAPGRLEVAITVEDPKTFSRPWTTIARYRKLPGYQMPEEVCAENLVNRSGAGR